MTDKLVTAVPKGRWLRLIPIIIITNIFYFMDRQVISLALPGGMLNDLAMNATLAGFATGITAIGMLFLQVPAGKWAQQGLAKKVVTISILCWSILSLLTAFVQVPWHLFLLRFVLGVSEGVVMPSITTMLTYWFPDKDGERNQAMSAYFTGNSIAMVVMGPLAGTLITSFGWRVLFIILGLVSFICCILWVKLISERPETAKWLSKEESDYIVTTINAEREMTKAVSNIKVQDGKIRYGSVFTDKNCLALIGISFCTNIGGFGFVMWLPTMLKNLTQANILNVGFLTMLPNIAACVGLWCFSYFTKKSNDRRIMIWLPMFVFAVVLDIATTIPQDPVTGVIMLTLAAFFIMGGAPAYATIPSLIVPPELDGPLRGIAGVAAGLGSFVGPYLVGLLMTIFHGSTSAAMYTMAAIVICGSFLSFVFPRYLGVNKLNGQKILNKEGLTESSR